MGKATFEGTCVPMCDYDGSALRFVSGPAASLEGARYMGVLRMVRAAGAEFVSDSHVFGFENVGSPDNGSSDEWVNEKVADYRAETGREHPPLYRVRVVVEAEPVSDEEAAAYWRGVEAKNRGEVGDG